MAYVDGFVIAVPTKNREAYKRLSTEMLAVFKRCGAIQTVECWGDDVPDGKVTSFPLAVKAKDDETVVFSWIMWPSKEVRDAGNEMFMQDPAMKAMEEGSVPFDGKRMIMGGFEVLIEG